MMAKRSDYTKTIIDTICDATYNIGGIYHFKMVRQVIESEEKNNENA